MERIVEVVQDGRLYTFTVEHDWPLSFWRVDTPGRASFRSASMVTGNETPEFFRRLAQHSDNPANWP